MPHKTQQRSSILEVMEELGRPVTPSELLKHASVKSPGLGLATVYRALKQLVKTGKSRKIEMSPKHEEGGPNPKSGHIQFLPTKIPLRNATLILMRGGAGGLIRKSVFSLKSPFLIKNNLF